MSTNHQLNLSEVQEAFTQWRVHRQPRHVPDTLREQAVSLLKAHKIGEVVKALGIKHQMLHRWKQALTEVAQPAPNSAAVFYRYRRCLRSYRRLATWNRCRP